MSVVNIVKTVPADSPDTVLEQAKGIYKSVFVIGYTDDGFIDARGSPNLDPAQTLYLLEQFKMNILIGDYDE
jgi:hypothetical protein